MTTNERITELLKYLPPSEVAKVVGVSATYVYNVRRKINPKTLTLPNYIEALQMGIITKAELAQYFGVGRSTLWRFEQKNMTRDATTKLLYLVNGDMDAIKSGLTNAEAAELAKLPTLPQIKKDLQKMLAVLSNLPQRKEPPFAGTVKAITAALKSLNC